MQAIGSNFDWTNKENLKPLIEFIQKNCNDIWDMTHRID